MYSQQIREPDSSVVAGMIDRLVLFGVQIGRMLFPHTFRQGTATPTTEIEMDGSAHFFSQR